MRLIDADALMDLVQKTHCTGCNNYNKVKCRACEIGDMLNYLDDAPTVDQWHYPSKGEYPPKGREVLCVIWNGTSCVAYLREDNEWTTNGRNAFDNVRVWQSIEPPKERA